VVAGLDETILRDRQGSELAERILGQNADDILGRLVAYVAEFLGGEPSRSTGNASYIPLPDSNTSSSTRSKNRPRSSGYTSLTESHGHRRRSETVRLGARGSSSTLPSYSTCLARASITAMSRKAGTRRHGP